MPVDHVSWEWWVDCCIEDIKGITKKKELKHKRIELLGKSLLDNIFPPHAFIKSKRGID